MAKSSSWLFVLSLWLLVHTDFLDGQVQFCNEFSGIKVLYTDGSRIGVIKYPSMLPKYRRNQICNWRIQAQPGEIVQLSVRKCSIQARDIHNECYADYVNVFDVRDGAKYFVNRFCGTENGMLYRSTGPALEFTFLSDSRYEYAGFHLVYQAQRPDSHSDNHREELAIAIPIAVVVVLTGVIVFAVILLRRYCRRTRAATGLGLQPANSSAAATPNSSAAATPFVAASLPPQDYSAQSGSGGRGPPRWGAYHPGQGYHGAGGVEADWQGQGGDLPLQVVLPGDENGGGEGHQGRSSPPPAYESLGYEDSMMTPPPYDSIVKDSEGEGGRDTDT